jgi:excisionase family DNA binding protein
MSKPTKKSTTCQEKSINTYRNLPPFDYYTLSQVVEILNVTRFTIYKNIEDKKIPNIKVGNTYIIPKNYINTLKKKTIHNWNF